MLLPLIKIFKLLERMEKENVLTKWAVGGAIGCMFYTEPFFTKDIDVFIYVQPAGSGLIDMSPIFDWLKCKGYKKFEGQSIIIEEWKVDFIPASAGLVEEAVEKAKTVEAGEARIRIMSAEHLIAIALHVGRKQDYAKIEKILQQGNVDKNKMARILKKFDLYKKWELYENT
ncbi:MAG: hypothetical protein HZB81_08875 [Deltaproteobacteria bacterium]|nr:hypothetical protein [Deltaproteobacteria bacterium]